MKKTQLERVKYKLKIDKFITRNEALKNRITRLGAIICLLERENYIFEAYYTIDKKDYIYKVIYFPPLKLF